MNTRDRAKLRRQDSRDRYQTRSNVQADNVARSPYISGRFAGFDVDRRSVKVQTRVGKTVVGRSAGSKTLGKRVTVQRTRGRAIAL